MQLLTFGVTAIVEIIDGCAEAWGFEFFLKYALVLHVLMFIMRTSR